MAQTTPKAPRQPAFTPLREMIVDIADQLVAGNIVEDAGPNTDSGGMIAKFFEEGAGQRGGGGQMWCAAFASYCIRKGIEASGSTAFPIRFTASGPDTKKRLEQEGLFITIEELYEGKTDKEVGSPKETARLPGPGDFVVFNTHHIGLVKSFDHKAKRLVTIEGNNTTDNGKKADGRTPAPDGVYEHNISARRLATVLGFGIVDPAP